MGVPGSDRTRLVRQVLRDGVRRAPLDEITDWHGFSFGASGWHYLRELIVSVQEHPDFSASLERSTATRFLKSDQVRRVQDSLHRDVCLVDRNG